MMRDPLSDATLGVEDLVVEYPLAGGRVLRAVDGVSFDVAAGETLALVGESGCGKSSIVRALMQLSPYSRGAVRIGGVDLAKLAPDELKRLRPRFQMIFQDPISSLNPRRRVRDILEAPLRINRRFDPIASAKRIREVLELVGVDPATALDRYPHEFSGGQCQRISIARALVLEPDLLVCDEPVSALDVSVRAQVLNVLNELRERLGLSMLFITHDLAVVRNVADRVAVMYLGRICEIGEAGEVLDRPAHPYTACLLSAVPVADPDAGVERVQLTGEIPSPMDVGPGCRFRSRCPAARELCARVEPGLTEAGRNRSVACHFPVAAEP
ncbi:MAG: ATP-binding cassette domain-containing protein [Burkholderiaceae bacterium]|nr:ATP-binding cassette domain-containing protein [Burkholderiaceae bacterium]